PTSLTPKTPNNTAMTAAALAIDAAAAIVSAPFLGLAAASSAPRPSAAPGWSRSRPAIHTDGCAHRGPRSPLGALEGVLAGAVVELVGEVDGGVDQRQVGERLGEVAQLLTGLADLLGVQPQVVGVGEHLLEGQPGL